MLRPSLALPLVVAAVALVSARADNCPGSKAWVHAKCSLTAAFPENSCQEVAQEIIDRISGENGWKDPHNQGVYTLTSGGPTTRILTTQRVTGNNKYTDLQKWTLNGEGNSCEVEACSESQVFSIKDFSTNYCDLHDLYCGSQDGCPVAKKDFKYTETFNSCSQNDKSQCVASAVAAGDCKAVTTAKNFNLTQFTAKKWYIQQQMEVAYLPKDQNFCVSAMYNDRDPGLFGWTIAVTNKAYESDKTSKHQGNLCASEDSSDDPAKLQVAPCFLPKIAAGPYWVLEFNDEEGYALISGGQPTMQSGDGCKTGSGVNNAGLWIFTRKQTRDENLVQKVRGLAQAQGFDLSVLNDVDQTDCPV